MKRYEVWVDRFGNQNVKFWECEKSYPFKLQAIIWCVLNGYVSVGRGQYFLDPNIKIKEVMKDETH